MENKAATTDGPATSPVPRADDPATFATTLLFDSEDGRTISPPKRQPIATTPSLAKAFVRAARASTNGTQEPPLTFSTLLVAMLVDEDHWLRQHFESQEVRFDQIAEHRRYSEDALRDADARDLAPEYLATTSARAALEEAMRIARLASGETTVDLRHLCAAYPILSRWHLEDFQKFNIDRLEWARSLGAEMARRFPKERHYWSSYADRASPVPLTSFSADVYTEEDLLGIDRSVDALALLVASTRTLTPLAIGVFGPWGSGKSFFMRHLQRRIVGLRQDEQTRIKGWHEKRQKGTALAADAPLYFGEIVQVEFNAWHYNEGNLVASLIEHLFRNLRVLPDEGDAELARRRTNMLRQLNSLKNDLSTVDQTIDAAEKNVADAKADVEQANQAAEKARESVSDKANEIVTQNEAFATERRKIDDAIRAFEPASNDVDPEAVIAVALGPLSPLLGEVRSALAALRDQAFDWKAFGERVFSGKGLMVLALCIAAPLVLWLTKQLEAQWAALIASMAAAFGGFGSALDVLKDHRARFEEKLKALDAEQDRRVAIARAAIESRAAKLGEQARARLGELSKALDARRQALGQQEDRLAQAARELAAYVHEHDARLSERVKAEDKVRVAEAELKRLSSALLLEEFIKDRLSTDEYRKQLGFLALVRRDIERLSHLIDQANKNWLRTDNQDAPPLINRIVLYIDDLDRCKESTVLAVLEAVHLLLAFPLFVCAVAVDPRWVEKCLRAAHRQLFVDEDSQRMRDHRQSLGEPAGMVGAPSAPRQSNGHQGRPDSAGRLNAPATVGDYLEKIFQIPIWMAPIASRARAALVNTLLGPTASPLPRRPGQALQSAAPPPAPGADGLQADAFKLLVSKARETPDPLRISPEEGRFIKEIAGLLSDRPRALKRLVNIYRLLKASLPDLDRASFVDDTPSSAYRVCLTQLALFTGHPRLAPSLVAATEGQKDETNPATEPGADPLDPTLDEWFKGLPAPVEPDLAIALQLIPNRHALRLGPFRHWLPHTSRYLFHRTD